MSNNNVPTEPGWYYVRIGSLMEIARVVTIHDDGAIFYELWGDGNMFRYPGPPEDTEIDWLGPVPMPGEFWIECPECHGNGDRIKPGDYSGTLVKCARCLGDGKIQPGFTELVVITP